MCSLCRIEFENDPIRGLTRDGDQYHAKYGCGCKATGPTPLPDYCPQHELDPLRHWKTTNAENI